MSSLQVSIIIPTLNEENNLPHVLPRIPRIPAIVETILVDGNSKDNTVAVAQQLIKDIKVVFQEDTRGKGAATICGARIARGDYFLVLDADGSQRPEEIPLYIQKAAEGFDLVKGSRYIKGGRTEDEDLLRKIIVRITYGVANLLWRTNFSDIGYGMFLAHRQKFLTLNLQSTSFEMEYELMIKAKRRGLKIVEIPSWEEKRRHGKSNLSYFRHGWAIAKRVFTEALRVKG